MMSPEERANTLVELVDRAGGYQSVRFVGQSQLLWHSADAGLMAERLQEMRQVIADAIREAVAAEREIRNGALTRSWTRTPPTVPGWYWTRLLDCDAAPEAVEMTAGQTPNVPLWCEGQPLTEFAQGREWWPMPLEVPA